jgi:hypothetical protein
MATCSVLDATPLLINESYPDMYSLDTFSTIAVQNIGAFTSLNGREKLTIGATSNLVLESYNDTQLYLRDNSGLSLFQTKYDSFGRHDNQILDIRSNVLPNNTLDVTVIRGAASSNAVWVHGDDTNKTTWVSDMQVRTHNNRHIQMSTYCPDGFLIQNMTEFNSNVIIDGSLHCLNAVSIEGDTSINGLLTVNDNAIVNGDVYSHTMNLFVNDPNATLSRVGYGFNINDKLELEVVKYIRFADDQSTTVKRVAVFGNAPAIKGHNAGLSSYMKFDTLASVVAGGGGGVSSGSPTTFYPGQDGVWLTNAIGNVHTSVWVGIGKDEPTSALDVVGTIKATQVSTTTMITQNFETSSDERLKNIIQDNVDPMLCLDKVKGLNVIDFQYLNSDTRIRRGLRAQQVKEVMSDAVMVRKFADLEDCQLIDTSVMLAYLVGAVKALAANQQAAT